MSDCLWINPARRIPSQPFSNTSTRRPAVMSCDAHRSAAFSLQFFLAKNTRFLRLIKPAWKIIFRKEELHALDTQVRQFFAARSRFSGSFTGRGLCHACAVLRCGVRRLPHLE